MSKKHLLLPLVLLPLWLGACNPGDGGDPKGNASGSLETLEEDELPSESGKPGTEPEPEPESESEPGPGPGPEPKPEPKHEPERERESEPETQPEPDLEPEPAEPPPRPTTLGVAEPKVREALWTAYYVAPVSPAGEGEGRTVSFTNLQGKKTRYTITSGSYRRAEMEAVAVGIDAEGNERFAYRIGQGKWKELPDGAQGMGNRMNPLTAFRHVAADQSIHRYGSMVHVEAAEGVKLEGADPLDGYFWIADTGGRVDGNHFDLFVGDEAVYTEFLHHAKRKRKYQTSIYRLPDAPRGMNPRRNDGLAAILRGKGLLGEGDPSEAELHDALATFQKAIHYIPEAEHGSSRSAVTLWFLIQAALELEAEQAE